jgi:hypothetical protein
MKTKMTPYYKIAFTFFVLSLTITLANGQEIVEKKNGGQKQASYLFASAGVSIPVGFIKDKSLSASTGPIISLGYHYFFNKRWGMGIIANGSFYKSKLNPYSNYSSTTSENWQRAQMYISASYTPILKNRWAVDIVQGIGLFYMNEPTYNYSYYNTLNSTLYSYNSYGHSDWNTGYNIGLRGRVLLKDNVGLFSSFNYFYALDVRTKGAGGFNSVDCELGIVVNLKK